MAAISGPNVPQEGLVLNIDPGSNLSYPARNDPGRDNISLLLDFQGGFIDKSRNALSPTLYGNSQVVSDLNFNNVGLFDGNGDYVVYSSSSLFNFGSKNFTIEFWIYWSGGGGNPGTIFTTAFPTDQQGVYIGVLSSGAFNYLAGNGSWAFNSTTTSNALSTNNWYHIAYVKNNNVYTVYINGIASGSTTNSTTLTNSNNQCVVGGRTNYSQYYNGKIANLIIYNGYAAYTSNFTPSKRFSLPARISDIKNDLVGTLTNGPAFSNIQGGVMGFDGENDSIVFSDNDNIFNFAGNDFAIALWLRYDEIPTGYDVTPAILSQYYWYGNTDSSWAIWQRTDSAQNAIRFAAINGSGGNVQYDISHTLMTKGKWHHIVFTRVGSEFYAYLDGKYVTSVVSAGFTIYNSSRNVVLGYHTASLSATGRYFKGAIGNLKIYKNKGLTASEVQKNYSATRKRFEETPKTISGLQLWLDAADLSTLRQNSNGTTAVALASDPVGYWGDKSGNGRHFIQATAGSRPTINFNQLNGLPALQFDGSDDWLYTNTSGTVGTIINVYYHTNSGWGLYDGVFSIRTRINSAGY